MKKHALLLVFLFNISYLLATSITIFNDSAYELHAEISDASGTIKGKIQIAKTHTTVWQDHDYNATSSLSPYSVTFLCPNNQIYGVYGNVSPGALVSATHSQGPKYCPKKKKQQGKNTASQPSPDQ